MSITTNANESVTEDALNEDVVLERPNYHYGYLGRDGEGYYHHVDEVTNTIYVTDEPYERTLPAGGAIYRITLYGNVNHIEDLNLHDDKDLSDWVAYVDSKRGWAERPKDITGALQRALAGAVRNDILEGTHR
ncbi:hypothetical protein [Natronobeatus ordinarius]|uniref:hypothetical protein n=1 Tax=Natronobeatus ordinarius TaxID=2963433 RepID=UPI0020CE17D7|nr:hypothetical protein [Natronobeatus ordinarius]